MSAQLPPIHAFTEDEARAVGRMLTTLVRVLRSVPGGGKLEEDYWSYVYHIVRGAPVPGWSNLPMRDYLHEGLGVEMKLLKHKSPSSAQGKRLMHPSATRKIEFDPSQAADICMSEVLGQFASEISDFRRRVTQTSPTREPELRWGILLWSPSLDQFLDYEEAMVEPDPNEFTAEFVESQHRGRTTRGLHIFEKATGAKRYSVTMPERGAKIQPYFDVPRLGEGAYTFDVPSEQLLPVWLDPATLEGLRASSLVDDSGKLLPRALRALREVAR